MTPQLSNTEGKLNDKIHKQTPMLYSNLLKQSITRSA